MATYPSDPFLIYKRLGTKDSPYIQYNSPIRVTNGKVYLTEIPNKTNHVTVSDGTTSYAEVQSQASLSSNNNYYVDYDNGIVYFDPSHNDKLLTFSFLGEGIVSIPATRVFTQSSNGTPTQDLQDMINNYNQLNGTDLYNLFDPQTGHKHTGGAGDAPPIDSQYVTYDNGQGTVSKVKDTLDTHASQLADIMLDVKRPPAPMIGLKGSGNDDTTALQNIINSITKPTRLLFPYDSYSFSSTLIINPALVFIEGYAVKFTFSNAGIAIQFMGTTQGYENFLSDQLKGIELVGPGKTISGSVAVQFSDPTVGDYGSFVNFEKCLIHDFYTGLTWSNNAWSNKFKKVQIYNCTYPVDYPSGLTNSGENISFDQSTIFNSVNGIRNKSGEIVFSNGSIDYIDNRFVDCELGGIVNIENSHIEGNSDTDYWLYAHDAQSSITIKGGLIALTGVKSTHEIGWANDPNGIDGGIFLDSVRLNFTQKYNLQSLITGVGSSRNILPFSVGANMTITPVDSQNYLVNGSFGTANVNEWTLASGGWSASMPTVDTTTGHTDTNSMKVSALSGQNVNVYHDVDVRPGDKPRISFWVKGVLNGTVDWWRVQCQYLDSLGNPITAPTYYKQFDNTNMPSNWTLFTIQPYQQAPSGSAKCRFAIEQVWGLTSDAKGTMWIDDIIISVD